MIRRNGKRNTKNSTEVVLATTMYKNNSGFGE